MNELFFACVALNGVALVLLGIGVLKLYEATSGKCDHLSNKIEALSKTQVTPINPKAGDTIVISSERMLNAHQVECIREHVGAAMPDGVKVAVLHGGLSMTHVSAPPPPEAPPARVVRHNG